MLRVALGEITKVRHEGSVGQRLWEERKTETNHLGLIHQDISYNGS